MFFMQIILYMVIPASCYSKHVFVKLADGGTSRPIRIMPLEHNHDGNQKDEAETKLPYADALFAGQQEENGNESDTQDYAVIPQSDMSENGLSSSHNDGQIITPDKILDSDLTSMDDAQGLTPQTEMIPTKTYTKLPSITKSLTSTLSTMSSTVSQSSSETTHRSKPILPCHTDCLDALKAMRLYAKPNEYLSQGSNLTLTCELPLNSSYILEDLYWLYHPENSPTHQCSLTKSEFLHSCQGFHIITDTDDRNSSFIQDSITVTNVLVNHSGQYMCQVKLTCCHKSQEHVMNKEKILPITVQIWQLDYTTDLVIAGSITASLAIVVIVGSYYISRRQRTQYIFITKDIHEIKASAVLHIPLVDDDNDSFDSNFDTHE
ncbi:uncharacterized protein LOC135219327 [Macrobrachium nipponense]|uniref:uncharacterized protein LOC135219327 n=1 Tax=Macrobrachium nipponense TaxID=159736 RepID=UPI0030C7D096